MLHLRGTPTHGGAKLTLSIQGELDEQGVPALERACEPVRPDDLTLDLDGLTRLDKHGLACMRALLTKGARMTRIPQHFRPLIVAHGAPSLPMQDMMQEPLQQLILVVNRDSEIFYISGGRHCSSRERLVGRRVSDHILEAEVALGALCTVLDTGSALAIELSDTRGNRYLCQLIPQARLSVLVVATDISDQPRRIDSETQTRQFANASQMETINGLAMGVAHDLANFLSVATILTNVTLEQPGDGQIRENLQGVMTALECATKTLDELRILARPENGQHQTLDINECINQAALLAQRALPSNIQLVLNPHTEPVRVLGDPCRLLRVLLNMLFNARDAMPGGGTLALESGLDERAGQAWIELRDEGEGIAPQHLERVFEPFFTTKPKGRGTGLGLANAHAVVSEFGGVIDVRSTVGRGTTFTVRLPMLPSG